MGIWVNRGPMDGATLLTMKSIDEMKEGSEETTKSKIQLMEGKPSQQSNPTAMGKTNAATGCSVEHGRSGCLSCLVNPLATCREGGFCSG